MKLALKLFFLFLFPHILLAEVIILDGVPASGKSTLAKLIKKKLGFVLVEADQIAVAKNPDEPNWVEGLSLGWKKVIELHKSGKSVVFDAWFDEQYALKHETSRC